LRNERARAASVRGKRSERATFDPDCTACPRLAQFLAEVRAEYPGFYARPVPPFGSPAPEILIVGLAPGLKGANRTGRPFTGDFAGILLYSTLHAFGLASAAVSVSADDSLRLRAVRITNAVKCVPPANKPLPAEIRRCNHYLAAELSGLASVRVVLALGRVAHESVLLALGLKRSTLPFGHGREHALPDAKVLVDSYHCSRYNTQTGRLTAPMFVDVVGRAVALAGVGGLGGGRRER
jgi:uracil-DNA glycosylase family 4